MQLEINNLIYQELSITTSNDEHKQIANILESIGADAITYMSKNNNVWISDDSSLNLIGDVIIKAIFAEDFNKQIIDLLFANQFEYSWLKLSPDDWLNKWRENIEIITINNKINICASWLELPQNSLPNLILDPGMAFGTGKHPTTYVCLSILSNIDLKDKTVLDLGCGSGILGIAALILGAKHVVFSDIDPIALEVTKENCDINKIESSKYTLLTKEQLDNNDQFKPDLIIANILAKTLIQIKNEIYKLCNIKTEIVLSGILDQQKESVVNSYPEFQFETYTEAEWVGLHGKHN